MEVGKKDVQLGTGACGQERVTWKICKVKSLWGARMDERLPNRLILLRRLNLRECDNTRQDASESPCVTLGAADAPLWSPNPFVTLCRVSGRTVCNETHPELGTDRFLGMICFGDDIIFPMQSKMKEIYLSKHRL